MHKASGKEIGFGELVDIAENTWAALQGRKTLEIEWDLGPNAGYDSEVQQKELLKSTRSKGTVRRERGNFVRRLGV